MSLSKTCSELELNICQPQAVLLFWVFSNSTHNSVFDCFQWKLGKMWGLPFLLKVSDNQTSRMGTYLKPNYMERSSLSTISFGSDQNSCLTGVVHGSDDCVCL